MFVSFFFIVNEHVLIYSNDLIFFDFDAFSNLKVNEMM